MPHPFLIFSPSDYLIQVVDINSHTQWQTVQIQIIGFFWSQLIWIYIVCKGRVYPGSARKGLNFYGKKQSLNASLLQNSTQVLPSYFFSHSLWFLLTQIEHFYTLPHNSGMVLWFHIGCSCVRPSIFLFTDDNLSKYQRIFAKLGMCIVLWRSGLGLLIGRFCQFSTELSACKMIVADYYHFVFCTPYVFNRLVVLEFDTPKKSCWNLLYGFFLGFFTNENSLFFPGKWCCFFSARE